MPIHEYYCSNNHKIYQFYARTLAQGKIVPNCPDNPKYQMRKLLSAFAVTSGGEKGEEATFAPAMKAEGGSDDARMEAAMGAMEKEFANVDENDPRAMGRMMRRMAEMAGEKIDGEIEEVVRKLEEGADPNSLEEQLGGTQGEGPDGDEMGVGPEVMKTKAPREPRTPLKMPKGPALRDPKLYDYE